MLDEETSKAIKGNVFGENSSFSVSSCKEDNEKKYWCVKYFNLFLKEC